MKAGAGEARSLAEATETLLRIQAGLPIKNPPKKTHLKNPQKNVGGFLGFFKFLIFYENNTTFLFDTDFL
jgi:hypothetical protein